MSWGLRENDIKTLKKSYFWTIFIKTCGCCSQNTWYNNTFWNQSSKSTPCRGIQPLLRWWVMPRKPQVGKALLKWLQDTDNFVDVVSWFSTPTLAALSLKVALTFTTLCPECPECTHYSHTMSWLTMLLRPLRVTVELTWRTWVSRCNECPRMLSNSVECFTSCAVWQKHSRNTMLCKKYCFWIISFTPSKPTKIVFFSFFHVL